jgi:FkbM family methyltransferase
MWKHRLAGLSYHMGRRIVAGGRRYRVRGYVRAQFATEPDHEPHVLACMARLLRERPGALIDVGMNGGQTLMKLLALDPDRPYVGFDPQLSCCADVQTFVADNGLRHKHVLPLALSDRAGLVALHSRRAGDDRASILEGLCPGASAAEWVPAAMADDVLEAFPGLEIALVKIDVEGAEGLVLAGMRRTLARHRPPVLFEMLPNFTGPERRWLGEDERAANRGRAKGLEEYFAAAGYTLFELDDAGGETRIHRFELDRREGPLRRDYLARPAADDRQDDA